MISKLQLIHIYRGWTLQKKCLTIRFDKIYDIVHGEVNNTVRTFQEQGNKEKQFQVVVFLGTKKEKQE